VARDGEGEIHEELARAGALHEAAEQHENHDVGRRDAKRRAEDPFRGHEELVEEAHRLDAGDGEAIDQEHERGERQGPADQPPRRLQHEDDHDDRKGHVGRRQIVDVVDAVDEVVVVPEQVKDRRDGEGQQEVVDELRRLPDAVARAADHEEGQGHREQEVRAPEDDRLRGAGRDDPHVIESHGDRDQARHEPDHALVVETEPQPGRRNGNVH
jgi:hypothetical protein